MKACADNRLRYDTLNLDHRPVLKIADFAAYFSPGGKLYQNAKKIEIPETLYEETDILPSIAGRVYEIRRQVSENRPQRIKRDVLL